MIQSLIIDSSFQLWMCQQAFNLRCKKKSIRSISIINRFYSKSISGQKKTSLRLIPKCKSEHPSHIPNTINPMFFIQMRNYFCISVRMKTMASILKIAAHLSIVVGLTIVYHPDVTVFISKRLSPRIRWINN